MNPDELLARACAEGTPLIEGDRATFVWHGEEPPRLVGDFNHWGMARPDATTPGAPATLTPIAPHVWVHTVILPRDAYSEYAYLRGDGEGVRVPDPLNSRVISDGMGGHNHFFGMPGYRPTPFAEPRPTVPHGTITTHVIQDERFIIGGARTVHLYRPPVAEPVPLLVVFDG